MNSPALYWDASALISAAIRDVHSDRAAACATFETSHIVSSLAWSEAHAVISHFERERQLAEVLCNAARDSLDAAMWRRANIVPSWHLVSKLARTYALKGADLWHLAAAKTLQLDLPGLAFLSFDAKLAAAAVDEGLPVPA